MVQVRVAALVVTLFCAACSFSGGDSSLSSASSSDSTALEQFQTSLLGTWSRPCQINPSGGSYIESFAFAGTDDSFTGTEIDSFYSDSACSLGDLALTKNQQLNISGMTPFGNAWSYSATIVAQSWTPNSVSEAQIMNNAQTCGFNNWKVLQPLDTTTSGACNPLGTGSAFADLLYLSGGKLYRSLGDITSVNTPSGCILQGVPYTHTH